MTKKQILYSYAPFLLMGLIVLFIGPLAAALFAFAVYSFCHIRCKLAWLFELPWLSGLTLFFMLWLPSALAAEHAAPGSLYRLFVRESFLSQFCGNYGKIFCLALAWTFALKATSTRQKTLGKVQFYSPNRGLRQETGAMLKCSVEPIRPDGFLARSSTAQTPNSLKMP